MVEQKIVIEGGRRIEGEIAVQGAKNSSLPLLAAAVLCKGEAVLFNCPDLTDTDAALRILSYLECKCKRESSTVTVNAGNMTNNEVPIDLMREMRSSIVFLGAILGRAGSCKWSMPGGCELGPRPINMHLDALMKMGVEIKEEHGFMYCSTPKGIQGATISLAFPSVGATENIILAAVTAKGETVIHNAAREPEIEDLCEFLNKCGAKIKGAGNSTVTICGVSELGGAEHTVIPDRIAAATYMCCAAITRGELALTKADYGHMSAIIPIFEQTGCNVYTYGEDCVYINARRTLRAPGKIITHVHPGFPTDAQPLFMALATTLPGATVFVENIFENRFKHASELNRLGARIDAEGKFAVVQGVARLSGADVEATDLRGGASLVTAALAADGVTKISRISHIDRGYEDMEKKLHSVGANIRRM